MATIDNRKLDIDLLRQVPLFRDRDPQTLQHILRAAANRILRFEPGARILDQGAIAHSMFIILDGTVEIRIRAINGREIGIGHLSAGDFFGEQALMSDSGGTRNAGIRAITPVRVFEIQQQSISRSGSAATRPSAQPFAEDDTLLQLKNSRLLQGLDEEALLKLSHRLDIRYYEPGQVILDRNCHTDHVHILLKGEAELLCLAPRGREVPCGTFSSGRHFTREVLFSARTPRGNACVRAINVVLLGRIPRSCIHPGTLPGVISQPKRQPQPGSRSKVS